MGDSILSERISFLHLHMHHILNRQKIVRHRGFKFWEVHIIFTSSHAPYLVIGKKLSDMGDSVFGERKLFTSSHASCEVVGEKLLDMGIQF